MEEAILSIIEGSLGAKGETETTVKVKSLRKMVLLSLRRDESEKSAKREYKQAVQTMEKEGKLVLTADGDISLPYKAKSKKRKEKDLLKPKKKRKALDVGDNTVDKTNDMIDEEKASGEDIESGKASTSGTSCKGNSQGITRLFVGNLPFAVDEASLKSFIPGVTHIKVSQRHDFETFLYRQFSKFVLS